MPLYLFLLVVVSLGCGSLPAADLSFVRPLVATIGMVTGWAILCHVGARLLARQVTTERLDPWLAARYLETQLDVFRWLGLGVVVLCLAGFGLARTLDAAPLLDRSMLARSLVLLTPGLLIATATWSAENYFGVLLGWSERSLAGHLRTVGRAFRATAAWLLVPVLVLVGLADLIGGLPLGGGLASGLAAVGVLALVPIGLPWLVRHLFGTRRLDPETDAWVGMLLSGCGLRGTRSFRWETGGRTFNAMIAGFIPGFRTVLVSDRILDELPRDQTAMVLLHEAAHLRRRHVPLRMACVLPAWAVGMTVTRLAGDQSWAGAAGTAAGVLITLCALRLVAYRTEFDADAQACRLAERLGGAVPGVPVFPHQAAAALRAALLRVTQETPSSRKPSWLHPGLAARLDRLDAYKATDREGGGENAVAQPISPATRPDRLGAGR